MSQWSTDVPGRGDADGITNLGARLDSVTATLLDARTQLEARRPSQVYRAEFLSAFNETAAPYLTQLGDVTAALGRIADALAIYGAEVRRIADESAGLPGQRESAMAAVATARTRLNTPSATTGGLTASEIAQYTRELDDAQNTLTRINASLDSYADDRRHADTLLIAALESERLVTGWHGTGVMMSAGGITRSSQIDDQALTDAMVELSQDVLDGSASEAEAQALAEYLRRHLDDPRTLDAYFQALGGRRTAELIDRLGDAVLNGRMDETVALDLALAVQAALSVASQGWSTARSESFALSMIEADGAAAAVAFLFGDPANHPMGETFAVTMANLIDENERLNGNRWVGSTTDGGFVLANLLNLGLPGRADDPASAILETLGFHPDAALAWADEDRIAYWFGERDWSSDGFQGVGSLWAGMQRASGANAEDYNPYRWSLLQLANARVYEALALHPGFTMMGTSAAGATYIGDALRSQIAVVTVIASQAFSQEFEEHREADLRMSGVGLLGEVAVPNIPVEYLYRVFGVTSSYDHVHDVLRAAITDHQRNLGLSGEAAPTILNANIALQALLHGTAGGAQLADARQRDEIIGQSVDTIARYADLATSLKDTHPVVAVTVSVGIDGLAAGMKSWTAVYDEVDRDVDKQNRTDSEIMRQTIDRYVALNFSAEQIRDAILYQSTTSNSTRDDLIDIYHGSYAGRAQLAEMGASSSVEDMIEAANGR